MKPFLDEHFLLDTKTAEYLYHEHAEKMPIIDFHSHLLPQQMANNHQFENITQAWLYGDHYKWRAMRTNGVQEKFCTGNASDEEKFMAWAATLPYTLRNPLYHWTHMELKGYFGIEELLNPQSASAIYQRTSEYLQTDAGRVQGLLQGMKVELVCTTDDPIDSLEYHQAIAASHWGVKVLPTWRPDRAMAVENALVYNQYLASLEKVSNKSIHTYTDFIEALEIRHQFFHDLGCRLSDHGLESFYTETYTEKDLSLIFAKLRLGHDITPDEVRTFQSGMLYQFALMNDAKDWTQQFHFGAQRNNNSRQFKLIGADTGYDSIGEYQVAASLSRFLNRLERKDRLAKTILYNLNPSQNEVIATLIGNFQDGSIPGKIQWGSGWWFLDQKEGMQKQLNTLSCLGLLSRFVGMVTDSRSFLSYPRHEYFRRILCNLLGNDVERGELPNDQQLLGEMVENICYYNAKNYFKF